VDEGLRRRNPERSFPGATDVEELAAAVVRLFKAPADELNGARLRLAGQPPQ
jgi:3-oxoacyl-[acyl-carrier protein] reductase